MTGPSSQSRGQPVWLGPDLLRDGHLLVPAQPGERYEERIETRSGADQVSFDSAQGPPLAHAAVHHEARAQAAEPGDPPPLRMG